MPAQRAPLDPGERDVDRETEEADRERKRRREVLS